MAGDGDTAPQCGQGVKQMLGQPDLVWPSLAPGLSGAWYIQEMKVGVVLGNELPAGEPMGPHIESILRLVATAREYGFDCVKVGQHYLSWPLQTIQPIPLLGRIAAETGNMGIGTGVLLLPLHHPVEIAEQVATLDAISGGRFIFGVGLGYEDEEFAAFGIDKRNRVGRFEEAIELIKRLWTEDRVHFEGKHFRLDAAPSVRPVQKPHPPIWIAANNHSAVRRAARLGAVWYANPHAKYETLAHQMDIYQVARAEAGLAQPDDVVVMREVSVAGSQEEAARLARPYVGRRFEIYVNKGQDKAQPQGDDTFSLPFDELAADRFILGNPDDCVGEIRRYESLGFNYLIIDFQHFGMPEELASACLHLFGREVLPRVR